MYTCNECKAQVTAATAILHKNHHAIQDDRIAGYRDELERLRGQSIITNERYSRMKNKLGDMPYKVQLKYNVAGLPDF